MKHLINIVVFLAFWLGGYVCGDGVMDSFLDVISVIMYISGLAWLYYRYG